MIERINIVVGGAGGGCGGGVGKAAVFARALMPS